MISSISRPRMAEAAQSNAKFKKLKSDSSYGMAGTQSTTTMNKAQENALL